MLYKFIITSPELGTNTETKTKVSNSNVITLDSSS